jgi:hypothetical protein
MKTSLTVKTPWIAALLLLASGASLAGSVGPLTTFNAGTTAVASEVNGNFNALSTAVNDNHARIGALEGMNAGGRIGTLEGLVHSPGGTGENIFLGVNSGNTTMTGVRNTGNGRAALYSLTTGGDNTASGYYALVYTTTGYSNTASGSYSLWQNTEGRQNTAIGNMALYGNTTGIYNIAIGYQAGYALTTGRNNIAIGNEGVAGEENTIRIGGGAFAGNQTRTFISGIRGVTTATPAIPVLIGTDGQLGTLSSSRRVKDNIADMGEASSTLMKLRPVTFHYKADQNPKGRSLQYGLIAEEVEKVAPGLVARSANGEIETVFYQHLTPMLLNEYQKQQRLIEIQTAELKKQTARVAELEQERRMQTVRLEALEKQAATMNVVLKQLERARTLTTAGR